MLIIGSLKVTVAHFRVLLTAIMLAAISLISMEAAARTPMIVARMPSSYGNQLFVLDHKFFEIEHLIEIQGRFDCVIIGDSALLRSIDPVRLSASFEAHSGKPLHCYNFGAGGLRPQEGATVAEVIAEKYHPSLIVMATHIFDLEEEGSDRVRENAWIRYQQHQWSIRGWLLDNVAIYRIHTELSLNTPKRQKDRIRLFAELSNGNNGFAPRNSHGDAAEMMCFHQVTGTDYVLKASSREELAQIDRLNASGQRIILVELPLSPQLTSPACRADYPDFQQVLRTFSRDTGIPLIEAGDIASSVPDDGWADSIHVNQLGARVISDWLGKALGLLTDREVLSRRFSS
jgi:hypothetical protein